MPSSIETTPDTGFVDDSSSSGTGSGSSSDSEPECYNNNTQNNNWSTGNPVCAFYRRNEFAVPNGPVFSNLLQNNNNRNSHRRHSVHNFSGQRMAKQCIDPFFEPKIVRKNNSIVKSESKGSLVKESKVLVIYTGGTIGMVKNDNGGKFKKKF